MLHSDEPHAGKDAGPPRSQVEEVEEHQLLTVVKGI